MNRSLVTILGAAGLLAGCGGPGAPAASTQTDAPVLGNIASSAGDPALTAALREQIMVDPALVQEANADAVRPPTHPLAGAVPPDGIAARAMAARLPPDGTLRPAPAASGACPQCDVARRSLTIGALAQQQGGRTGRCATTLSYSAGWANRLPAGVPLYPDARVAEAAGADAAGCALRIVSFASAAPMNRLLDWYYTRTGDAGYDAGHGADGAEHVLAGSRRGGTGAFMLVLRARPDGGTDADLLADGG